MTSADKKKSRKAGISADSNLLFDIHPFRDESKSIRPKLFKDQANAFFSIWEACCRQALPKDDPEPKYTRLMSNINIFLVGLHNLQMYVELSIKSILEKNSIKYEWKHSLTLLLEKLEKNNICTNLRKRINDSKELKCLFYTLTQHYSHIKYGDCAISFRNRPKKHTVEELLTLSEKLKSYIDQEN